MKIDYLPRDEAVIRAVATWIYEEWLQANSNASVERMVSILESRAESRQVPLMVIATDDQGAVIGTASLVECDMKSHPELTPWLAAVYVPPQARGRGIGRALCRRIEEEARRLGFAKAYLFTKDQQRLYATLGWRELSVESHNGMQVTIMELALTDAS